jgi:hypothetical protein
MGLHGLVHGKVRTAEQHAPVSPARTRRVTCDCCGGWGAHGGRCPASSGIGEASRRCSRCGGNGYFVILVELATVTTPLEQEAITFAAHESRASLGSSLWNRGSFAEVERAVLDLEHGPRSLVWRAYVSAVTPAVDLSEHRKADLKLYFAKVVSSARTACLPGRIRVPRELREWLQDERSQRANGSGRWANTQAQGVRNSQIRALVTGGMSSSAVARRYGLHRATVARIVG